MVKNLKSITSILKVFPDTQRSPVVVMADNMQEYICKHSPDTPCSYLFNEYLANQFLTFCDGIVVPEMAIINIREDHLKPEQYSNKLQPRNLRLPTIGFAYYPASKEVDNLWTSTKFSPYDKRKFSNTADLLKISLFDIWMCNEDRNQNNYNLLVVTSDGLNYFVPIDHESIFNTNSFHRDLTLLTEEDSIIHSMLFSSLFPKQKARLFSKNIEEVSNNIYLWRDRCNESLDKILSHVPPEWKINSNEMNSQIRNKLFSDDWLAKVVKRFKSLIQTS